MGLLKRYNKLRWERSNSDDRFAMVRKSAQHSCIDGFSHIVSGKIVSGVIKTFGQLQGDGGEFEDVLDYREHLFIGNNRFNKLIVLFMGNPVFSTLFYWKDRVRKIELQYPRLRYVFVVDTKYIEFYKKLGLNAIFLKDYDSPEVVVKELENYTVDEKKCIIPMDGEGI